MSEETRTVNGIPLPRRSTRRKFVISMMVFCALVIILVTSYGNPENSLHTSSLAWAWGVAAATFFGYVFGAVIDNFNVMRLGKRE